MNTETQTTYFKNILRTNGLKATPARLTLLGFLDKTKKPLSAQAMIDHLGNSMDAATIYRILCSLKTRGIIKQVDLRHNHAHYELAHREEHHHLVCLRCGAIEDVHECNIDDIQSTVLAHAKNFARIEQHALEFYGVCKACERAERSS